MSQWNLTINLGDLVDRWKSGELDISQLAEKVVKRIQSSGWRELTPYPHTFDEYLASLKAVSSSGGYQDRFEDIYDLADSDRVWIETC